MQSDAKYSAAMGQIQRHRVTKIQFGNQYQTAETPLEG